MQKLRREISSVWPDQCLKLGVDGELAERRRISQRLENGSMEFGLQIDLTSRAVAESEPNDVTGDVPRFQNVVAAAEKLAGSLRTMPPFGSAASSSSGHRNTRPEVTRFFRASQGLTILRSVNSFEKTNARVLARNRKTGHSVRRTFACKNFRRPTAQNL